MFIIINYLKLINFMERTEEVKEEELAQSARTLLTIPKPKK